MTQLGPPRGAGPACRPPPSIPTGSSSGDIPWHTRCVVQRHRGQLEHGDLRGTEPKAAAVGYHAALCSAVSFTSTKGNTFSSILATGMLVSHQTMSECRDIMSRPYKPTPSPGGSWTRWFALMPSYTGLACTPVHVLPVQKW